MDGVLDRHRAQGSAHLVGHRGVLHPSRQVDGELGAVEDVDGLRPVGQRLPGSSGPDDGALAGLGHAVVSGIQHAEADLVPHVQQGAQHEAEGEALVVGHKVPHVLQQEVTGAVEVTVGQEGHDHAVLHHGPVPLVEAVHAAVALAGGAAHDELHLPRQGQGSPGLGGQLGGRLHAVVTCVTVVQQASLLHCSPQQHVAVVAEDLGPRVVLLEGLGSGGLILHSPLRVSHARLVHALAQPTAASEDVHGSQGHIRRLFLLLLLILHSLLLGSSL
mmetsp:Transcript_37282/g.82957  ORF Transcript_37282/g.82957 Transcript_37282/m.82957 type:complete len:274 (-) Transcript_37282:1004-1825(-)